MHWQGNAHGEGCAVSALRVLPVRLSILLLFLVLLAPVTARELFTSPGYGDLTDRDFSENPVLFLNGVWLFRPGNDPDGVVPVAVPGSWGKAGLPEQGFGTYLLTIKLPADAPGLSIQFGSLYTSSVIRLNGVVMAAAGRPGNGPENTQPQWSPVVLDLHPDTRGEIRIEVEMANYHHTRGGIVSPVMIGGADILRKRWQLNRLLELVIMGAMFWMGCYHLILYSMRHLHSRSSLFLGLACLLFSLRVLFVGDFLLNSIFPDGTWAVFMKVEYLLYILSVYCFVRFLSLLFVREFYPPVLTVFMIISLTYATLVALTPSPVYTSLLPLHQVTLLITFLLSLYYLGLACVRRRPGSVIILASMILVVLTGTNDILFYRVQIVPYNLSLLGAFLFTMADSYILGKEFTRKYIEAEALSLNLRNSNTQLEESRQEIRQKNRELHLLANSDYLTGLPNRMALFDQVNRELTRAQRSGNIVGVLLVDLDDFKQINDSFGHTRGDQLLCEFSRRVTEVIRTNDTMFRLGGDEFTVIATDLSNSGQLVQVARKIMGVLDTPIHLNSMKCKMSTSIGISQFPRDGKSVNTLLKHADIALYEAKRQGRNRYISYNKTIGQQAENRYHLTNRIPEALQQGAFKMYFQPQVDLKKRRLYGLEALIRWEDGAAGFIPPSEFIPLAEESGFITVLGQWILEQSCRISLPWLDQIPDLYIGVNISSIQFTAPDFLEILEDVLRRTGFPPRNLVLELTEGVIMNDSDGSLEKLKGIRAMGIRISVDDFGTGYSSLSYLKKFPLDHLKIDKCFITDLFRTGFDREIVRTIIDLAGLLDLDVIAERVETAEQQAFLEVSGCYLVQGYLFSKPLPFEEAGKVIREECSGRKIAIRTE